MVSLTLTSQMCTAISIQGRMILLWLMVARTVLALASAELKLLRTHMRTDVAAVNCCYEYLCNVTSHKLDMLCVSSSVRHANAGHATIRQAGGANKVTMVMTENWCTDSYDIWFMKIATQNGLTNLSYHSYGNAVITFINSYSFPYPPADLVCLSATPWAFGLSLVTMNQTLLYVTEAPEAHLRIVK